MYNFFLNIYNFFLNFYESNFLSLNKIIGISLGSENISIYIKSKGIVLNESSVVAYIEENGIKIGYLYGHKAKQMIGKTPMKIDTITPIKYGVIADFQITEEMMKYFFNITMGENIFNRPTIVIGVPMISTEVEKRAIKESMHRCGARDVYLVLNILSSAIGVKLSINEPNGCMIVNIGAGTVEVGVLSLGGIINGSSIRFGCADMDNEILEYIKNEYQLLIGISTAQEIKIAISTAKIDKEEKERNIVVRGRDFKTGIPKEILFTEHDILNSISGSIQKIINEIKKVLEIIPPEISADIVDRGIVLCGGGANIKNIDTVISQSVDLPVFIPPEPALANIRGIGIIVENIKSYNHVLFV